MHGQADLPTVIAIDNENSFCSAVAAWLGARGASTAPGDLHVAARRRVLLEQLLGELAVARARTARRLRLPLIRAAAGRLLHALAPAAPPANSAATFATALASTRHLYGSALAAVAGRVDGLVRLFAALQRDYATRRHAAVLRLRLTLTTLQSKLLATPVSESAGSPSLLAFVSAAALSELPNVTLHQALAASFSPAHVQTLLEAAAAGRIAPATTASTVARSLFVGKVPDRGGRAFTSDMPEFSDRTNTASPASRGRGHNHHRGRGGRGSHGGRGGRGGRGKQNAEVSTPAPAAPSSKGSDMQMADSKTKRPGDDGSANVKKPRAE